MFGLSFVTPPPFLVFDISSTFRGNIETLDLLPHEITAYNESYSGHFLYYDGIPATNPVLESYHGKDIEDISLLCYFPCEEKDRVAESMKSMFKPLAGSLEE